MGVKQKLPLIGSRRRIVRWFGYLVYLVIILFIISALAGSGKKQVSENVILTCPADKYLLSGEDFKESGWIVNPSEKLTAGVFKSIELHSDCYAAGKAVSGLTGYSYAILVYSNENAANQDLEQIKGYYGKKVSYEKLKNGIKISLLSGSILVLKVGNGIIYVSTSGNDPEGFADRIIDKIAGT